MAKNLANASAEAGFVVGMGKGTGAGSSSSCPRPRRRRGVVAPVVAVPAVSHPLRIGPEYCDVHLYLVVLASEMLRKVFPPVQMAMIVWEE